MPSVIYFQDGSQSYPEYKQTSPEGQQLASHPDVTIVRHEIFSDAKWTSVIGRGYGVFIAGQERSEIDTLSWPEQEFSQEYKAHLVQEIERRMGRENLVILAH